MNDSPRPEPPPAGKLLALSPHLDDAVFGCGRLLASAPGAVAATVFAGRPGPGAPLTGWDRAAGFEAGDDVVGRRREEDRAALEILGARPRWLDLRDSQYGGEEEETVAAGLRELFVGCRPDAILIPLGLFHSDHRLVHRAALSFLDAFPDCRWLAYEDALYRRIAGLREEAIGRLRQRGLAPRPVRFAERADAAVRKGQAVACYRSQLRALATPGRPGQAGLKGEEAFWQLSPWTRSPLSS
jgi:LmbE family N-acetylglucosaminyl deacetylase